jgi:hypothetical protein
MVHPVQELKAMSDQPRFPAQHVPLFLFAGHEPDDPNILEPVFGMAQELFTHIGIAGEPWN